MHAVAMLDAWVLKGLVPLGIALLVFGLDDLAVDIAWLVQWVRRKLRPEAALFPPGERQLSLAPKRRVAVLVPLWQEHEVIGSMLAHTLSSVRYDRFDVFAGCYPNDEATQDAVRAVAARHRNVHLALCPHDGPTSKADCLNWTWQYLRAHELATGERYDVLVTHDAEDIVHPEELRWVNYYTARFDFLQMPVLPLPTPIRLLIHGIYCDEFAEYHSRDMPTRSGLGAFLPGAGVGTAFRREALEALEKAGHALFEPGALTEDYVNGLRMFRIGCNQVFPPILKDDSGDPVATREFFPMGFKAALRQRTRWATGLVFQSIEQFGWSGTCLEKYWLWRDRKGLIGNPLSLVANLVFTYGLATGVWARVTPAGALLGMTGLALQVVRTAVRAACVARIYGWPFALAVPLRAVLANFLNSAASLCATWQYFSAKIAGRPLRWLKTTHEYPVGATLSIRRRLGELLVEAGEIGAEELTRALATKPESRRLGEHLQLIAGVPEAAVYKALGEQQHLPVWAGGDLLPRALPKRLVRDLRVLPFKIQDGSLHVAGTEPPTSAMLSRIADFTPLEIRFHLAPPSVFADKFATLDTCRT